MLIDLTETDALWRDIETQRLRRDLLRCLKDDPIRAHAIVFSDAHQFPDPPFHAQMLRNFHSDNPREVIEAFRGGAKSTRAEEAIAIRMAAGLFKYGLLLCNTYSKAVQRLSSIRSIIDNNPVINRLFGDLHGDVWNESRIRLTNGVTLAAHGARMSMRGLKEGDSRPDFCLIDDLEDEEWISTPEAIEANKLWLFRELVPALASFRTPIRMIGTPLADNSLLRQLAHSDEWHAARFPVRYLDAEGQLTSAWPENERFTLEAIADIERRYTELGAHTVFMQEYMCEATSPVDKVFTSAMLRCEPRIRTWQAVYAMIDPARTTRSTSAQTGHAVWSWAPGGRLDVWECGGDFLQPDAIVNLLFRLHETYRPVEIGVEQDGLEEWMMQPIRHEQAKRGVIPVRPVRAPRGKIDFIKGLQPFLAAGTAVFCLEPGETEGKFRNAWSQFLSFPRGVIDAPNALAYATSLRPGIPVYADFSFECVEIDPQPMPGRPHVACWNADGSRVTLLLCQEYAGVQRIMAEWIDEGQPADVVPDLARAAALVAAGPLIHCLGPQHFERYTNVGLHQALLRARCEPRPGADTLKGRVEVRAMLKRRSRGLPGLTVSQTCRFALNAFSAGFAFPVQYNNVAKEPGPGLYRTLIEGLENFVGSAVLPDRDEEGLFRETADGRRYRSAMR
jgi:hypothetical protein